MGLTASNDILSEGEEVGVKIKELPEKYNIELSEEVIKKYWEEIISFTQIEALRIKDTAWEKLDTLKGLFWLKAEIDTSGIKKWAEQIHSALEMWETESKKWIESLWNLWDNIDKALWETEVSQKIKETTLKAQKVAEEVWVSKWFDYIIDKIKSFGWWIGQLIAGILSFFKWLIWMWNKAKKAKDVAKKALSSEEVEKTKEKALILIEGNLWKYLTTDNKKVLEQRLNNLSDKELLQISEKMKKWNLTISDIKLIIPNIIEWFLSKEQIDKIKEDFNESLILAMEKWIKEKYNINITWEKKVELEKLIRKNTTISNKEIEAILSISQNKKLLISDVFWPTFEGILNTTNITFWLLTKWIVPLSAFSLDFLHSTTDIALLSLNALWIQKEIKLDSLNKKISELWEDEKALFIALLYRKWGILFSIVWSLMWGLTKFGIEASTTTNVKSFDLLKASVLGDYTKQSENLNKLEKTLGIDIGLSKELLSYKENIKHIINNYENLQILEKANWNIDIAKKLFSEKNIAIPNTDFEWLLKYFRDKSVKISTWFIEKGFMSSRFWFGKNADLHRLSKRIESITKAQTIMFSDIKIFKLYWQAKEALNIWELSRDVDKVMFHYDSIEDAKKWLSKWNVLANKSPELVKWLFDKFPIIVVAWLAVNSEEGFLENFKNNLMYLLPVVWSIMLIKDTWIDWSEDWKIKTINPLDAWIWAALLTIDWIFITKELAKWWLTWGGKYIIKPIIDLYSIARGWFEWASYLWKAISSGKSISSILEKSKGLAKWLPKIIPKKLKAILWVLAIWYFWIEYAIADDTLSNLFENGKLNKNKLKEYMSSWEVSDDEKILLIKYLISEEWGESYIKWLDISINNNKVNIISINPLLKTKEIINSSMLNLLWLNTDFDFKYKK